MKSFNQFLTESNNCIPLDLSETVEWFNIFDEELSEVDKLQVIEELSEEDLINLAWLKQYLQEENDADSKASDLKISRSKLEALRDNARKRESKQMNKKKAKKVGAPASPSDLRQSLKNLGGAIKRTAARAADTSPIQAYDAVRNTYDRGKQSVNNTISRLGNTTPRQALNAIKKGFKSSVFNAENR